MRTATPMHDSWRSGWKYHQLVITLLILLLLHPYVEHRDIFLKGLLMTVLLSGIYAVSKQTRALVLAGLIGIPTLVAHAVSIVLIHPYAEMAARVGTVLFMALTTIVIFRYILLEPEVTSDVLSGAVCVYLLSGLTWASLYILIDTIQPGSFHVSHSQNSGDAMTYSDFLFFSFATLTTVGYGDITPVTTHARSFAIVEAVYGVLYSAILIARVVGLYRPVPPFSR
jgi:voltage-gated potassium channel